MRLFLNGGGSAEQSSELDDLFASRLSRRSLLYIPQAAAPVPWSFQDAYEWIRNHDSFDGLRIAMWETLVERTYDELDDFDALFLMGGNTFTLLHEARRSGFVDLLRKFIDSDRIVYGISAGALVLGKNIETAAVGAEADSNDAGITDLSGLDCLRSHNFITHYEPADEGTRAYIADSAIPLIALPEPAGLVIEDGDASVVGTSPVHVFRAGGEAVFAPGTRLPLDGVLAG